MPSLTNAGSFAPHAALQWRQTGLTIGEVQTVLDRSEHVKMFDIPNQTGGILYALRHPGRLRKLKQYQQIFFTYAAREPLPSTH